MLTQTEVVWRHLLAEAFDRQVRRHDSITALADVLDMPVSTVHRALARPTAIGAVIVRSHRSLRVVHPWRLLMLWAAKRDLPADVYATSTTSASAWEAERRISASGAVISGFGGVVARRQANPIAPYDTVFAYGPEVLLASPGPTTVVWLRGDKHLMDYGPVAPLSQCFVDLFNTPGWKAARFVESLSGELIDSDVAAA
ncbi:MAG: hypothetical protein ACYCSF_08440 [Acidimicrobiales bacterium]